MWLSTSEIEHEQEHRHDSRVISIVVSNIVVFAFAAIAVVLRLLSRRMRRLAMETDDYMAVIALVLCAGFFTAIMIDVRNGLGKHTILAHDLIAFGKGIVAMEAFYTAGIIPVKLSIAFLYRRIFPNRQLRIALWVVSIVVTVMGIAGTILSFPICPPANWNPALKSRCINQDLFIKILGAQNVVTDFALLLLPMPLVWNLQIPRHRKIEVSAMFALGGL